MAKRTKMTKKELAYIKKYKETMSITSIATKLDRHQATVSRYIEQFRKEEQEKLAQDEYAEERESKNTSGIDLMGRRSGAVTMTEAASMYADEALKKNRKMPSSRYKNCIKIFDKDKPIR